MHLKIGRLLAMIVHCMVQFIVDGCKSCGPDILKIMFIIIKRRLKSERKKFQHTIIMKFGRPLAIIVHYTVQFNLERCKSCVSDMVPNTI